MSLKKQVISGVKWSTFSTITLATVGIIKISILARFLDKADFGLFALVTFVMGFMNLFNDLGLTSAILHKQKISKNEYSSLYWLNMLIGILMYLILLGITPFMSSFYQEPELNILIPLIGINLIFSSIGGMFRTIEQKDLNFKTISIFEVVAAFLSLSFAIYLAVEGFDVYALVYSALLQIFVINMLYLIIGLKKHILVSHFKYRETKPFLKIGIFQLGGQVVNVFNRDLDLLIIGKIFSTEILGGYSLAKQLVMKPMKILNPILSKVASPTLAKYQDDKESLRKNYLRLINVISSINIPAYTALILFASPVIQLLYGDGYEDITILVQILSIFMFFRALGNPMGSLVIATGRTDLAFYWNLLTLVISPVFIFIGSQFGVIGAAIGITMSIAILLIPSWKILINKLTGASLKEFLKACFVCNYSFLKNLLRSKV